MTTSAHDAARIIVRGDVVIAPYRGNAKPEFDSIYEKRTADGVMSFR